MNIAAPCFSIVSGVTRAQDSTIKSVSDFDKTPIFSVKSITFTKYYYFFFLLRCEQIRNFIINDGIA